MGTALIALFRVIALHIVVLFDTALGNAGIVTTCVLCSTLVGVGVVAREVEGIGVQLELPPENDEILTRDGRSESLSS